MATYIISTRKDKDSDEVQTTVEVDFTGFTLDMAKDHFFTSTSPRVALQARLRNMEGGIPRKISVKATDLVGKQRSALVREMTPEEIIERAKIDPEFRAKILAAGLGK